MCLHLAQIIIVLQLPTCHGLYVVYAITDPASFQQLDQIVEDSLKRAAHLKNTSRIMLVGNKSDLEHERAVSREMGEAKAQSNGWMFYETSAKERKNVDESFLALLGLCLDFLRETGVPAVGPQRGARCVLQ
jgi:GTPase SAR1 family protein